ncbi:MAG: DUF4347 domain-containing protein, partial [Bacteroidetes bacterium]|nr:DUF4347 domain-containing protein [Bacteroidota bacterium]
MSHSFFQLEPRLLFDASTADTSDHIHDDAGVHAEFPGLAYVQDDAGAAEARHDAEPAEQGGQDLSLAEAPLVEIFVIDASVHNPAEIEKNLSQDAVIIRLDADADGITALSQALSAYGQVDALHVFSHGSDGEVRLGTAILNDATLSERAGQVAGWSSSFSENGDMLLYGCDVAQSEKGQAFIGELARLTGVDVAASSDATGAAEKGGDWILEYRVGDVETRAVDADGYRDLLATPVLGGITATTNINDTATTTPFSSVTITDADDSDSQTVTITLDTAAKGALSNLGTGSFDAGTGVYTFTGTADQAQAAVRGLVFTPTENHVAPGGTETTTFTISVNDGSTTVTDSATTVVVTSVNDTPVAVADDISATEDTDVTPTGNVLSNDTDMDIGDTKTVTAVRLGDTVGEGAVGIVGTALTGTYGKLNLAANGDYTYTLDNNSLSVQTLGAGQSLTENFNYTMRDANGLTSDAVITVSIHGTNDAPVGTAASLVVTTPIPENASDAENPGVLASTLLQSVSRASLVIDVDSTDTTPGLVAYASSTTNGMTGTWQYQLSGSSTWNAFTPSISEAILIPHDALVRFVVDNSGIDSQESGKATLSYRVWDASSGSAGGTLAVTSSGGSTSISDASIDATFNVAARNDAPTLTPVQLDLNEGATAVITTATLPLLDPDNASEQLTYRVEVLPTHGQLLKNGIPVLVGSLFTQADIISGTISYRHTASELSLDQVDSVSFSVRDGAGGVISSVSLPIQIHDVNAQIAITGASQSVLEYVSGPATYTELNLGLSDADGNANLMTLTINTLPDAAVGKLQYWNGSAYVDVTAGTALTQAALLAHPLRFISTGAEPSAHPSATFTVTATDGHTTLAPTTASSAVTITIIAQNDPPSPETQTLPVNTTTPNPAITTAYLTATDPDSPDSKRVYTVSSNPAYGDLYLNGIQIGVGSTFTQADLDANHLTFHIDGGIFASDTPDSFNFRINDGDGGVSSGTLDITIAAGTYTGGGGPGGTLTGLTPEGLFTTVTSTILNNSESYTLTDLPDHGTLYFNGVALGLSGTFAQADIDTGAVVYVHDGTEPSGHAYADAFTVSRTGGTVSGSSSISLTITPVNDAPTITQTSGGATLLEHNTAGGDADSFDLTDVSNAVKLTTANVQAHDVESGPSELYYVLAQSPGTAGSIKQWNDTSSSWVALAQDARFSAQDVADGKIAYFHDPASEERSVSISVYLIDGGVVEVGDVVISGNAVSERNYATVTDGDTNSIQITKGNVAQSPTRTITFTINNVNDAPTASDTSFTVEEGAPSLSGQPDDNPGRIQVLNASILSASDSDNDLAMATYFIKTLPSYGRIEVDTNNDGTFDKILGASDLNGSGYIFTKAQLDGGRLRYVQDGSDQTLDNFSWGLNDNATTTPVNQDSNSATVTINILPVNDPPIVYKNEAITVTEGASYTITTAYLGSGTTSDIDSDNSALQTQYRVTTPPVQHGTLYLEKDGVITILGTGASFTLADIQAGYLKYTHNGSDPHLNNFEDGFGFTISDASGMTEPSGHFKINLTAVNDAPTLTPSIFGTTEYVEDASPVAIGSTVVFSDSDLKDATTLTPSLDGGTLEIAITNAQAGDILSVINAGLGAGQIGVSGNSVTFGGVQIGTIDNTKNGVSGQTLLITFNSNVTSDAEVQALIRAIGFSSSDTANPATVTRDLTITYDADGAGGDATQTVTGTASVTVTQINDRPELTSQSPNLGTVSEDLAAPYVTTTVSGLVGTSIDDVDTGAVEGIAITGLTNAATGKWQYSTNGSTWSDVGTVSTTSALLLRSTDFIRFVPDGKNGGTATISYKAWDQTSGNFGTKANTTANDTQTSAFSTATDTAQITVTDLNDAPTGTGNLTLTSTVEDTSNPTGAVINTLAGLNFQDVDSGSSLAGVLIVGNSANAGTQGVWEYSTDGNWKAIGTVADDATALALSATTQIRFVPAANYNGTPPALTIRAVDNTYTGSFSTTTEGAETRSTVNSSANGGTTAISGTTNTISTAVTPVNDTPTISGDKTINSVVTEGSALVISNVAAGLVVVRDVEASRNEGGTNRGQVSVTIAVPNGTTHGIVTLGSTSNVTITAGADSSASVTIKGTLENVNAALNGLSFTPGDDTNTSETVTVTVNDLGNSGTGTTTPLTATQTITIGAITPVNDAPTASGPSSVTATEDVQFSFTGGNTLRIADVDARTGTVEVALSIPSGMLIMTTTGVSVTSGDSGTGAITIHGTVSAVNAALGTLKYIGAADANSNNIDDNSRTLHMVVSDLGNSIGDSTTTPGTVSKDVLIVLNPVNDAPTLIIAGGSESQSLNQNTQASITGITVADYKDSGDSDYAVTAKPTLVITALHGTFEAFNQGNVNGVLSNENRTITLSSSNIGADSLTDINGVITAGYLKYTADSNFSGTDTLSLVLHDNGNSGGTDRTSSGTIALTIAGTNEAPSFGSLDATPTFVEDGPTVILDDDAILVDPELSVYNNWGNAVLTLQRTGQAGNAGIPATDDVFGLTGSGSTGVNFNGGNIRIASTAVGTFTNADGVLTITFAEGTTTAQATQVLRAVTYQNTNDNPPTQVSIGYTINDGDTDADRATNGQGTGGPKTGNGSINVTIAANNDTPSLNVPSTGSYTEDAASITLASAAALDDPELSFLATQNGDWERATLSLSRSGGAIASDVFGVTGSGDTGVNFDGGNIRINTTAVGTFTNAGGKLTITFAHNATSAQVEQIVRAITYENTRQSLAAGETESVALVWTLNDGNTGDANTPGPQGLGGAKQTTATETITLTGVNDAPVLADTALSITVAEDAAAPSGGVGVLVSSLTGGISDVDTTNPKGIAITGLDSTLGTWRYSTNGGTTWTSIDAVADSSSLLLRSTDRIHFQPTANINGSVSAGLTIRAWDQSTGSAGAKVDTTTTGGTSAFSSVTDNVALTVTAVNDAPTRTQESVALTPVDEDSTNPSGSTISSLFTAAFSDATDQVTGGSSANTLAGVAIVGNAATASQGTWQYFNGSSWTNIATTVSLTSATLFAENTAVRFVPTADFHGTPGALTTRLIDSSSGAVTNATGVNIGTTGGTTRFSDSSNEVTLTTGITAVNDAPVATGSATLSAIDEDTANGSIPGATITSLFGSNYNDVTDNKSGITGGGNTSTTLRGVIITGYTADVAKGEWEYKTDSGNWTSLPSVVTDTSGFAVAAADSLRFVPVGDYNGDAPDLVVRLVDGSGADIVTGEGLESRVDASENGDTTRYSLNTVTLSHTITAVADIAADTQTVDEDGDVTTNLLGNDSFEGTPVITSVTQGANGTVTIVDANAGTVKYTPGANFNGTDSYTYTVTSGGVTETATVTVTINQIDDPATIGGDISGSGTEDGGAIAGTLTATDPADGLTDGTIFSVTTAAGNGMASIDAASGAWTYTPNADYNGSDSFVVTITDDDGNTTTQT